jgi:hypothetical protein
MLSQESVNDKEPDRNEHGVRGFLKRKWWLGVGAIVAIFGVIFAILTYSHGSGSSSEQTIRANNGNCVIQAGNGNTCSVNQTQPMRATSSPKITAAQNRSADCQTLSTNANKESTQLLTLQRTISIDDPTSRVTAHTSGFASAYNRAFSLMQLVHASEDKFESDGGVINVDPKLDGDLSDMANDLPSLQKAVVYRGLGGPQWNQLSNYSSDFGLLATLKCVLWIE